MKGIRLTYDYVKNFIEMEGCTLLSTTYKNNRTKLKVRCPKGHIYKVTFGNFQQGKRCPVCSGNIKYTIDEVRKIFKKEGYTLLSTTYRSNKTKLKVRCPKGHEYKVTFSDFQQGKRCPVCSGNIKYTIDEVRKIFKKEGYTLLSTTYVNAHTKLLVRCPKGHEYKVIFNNFQQGNRCPICNEQLQTSKGEKEVSLFVESLGINIIRNDRTQIINPLTKCNLELDVWIPSLSKAIEYNGKYWHNKPYQKIKDNIKKDQCKKLGIDLLIIEDNIWNNNKQEEIDKIKMWIYKS